MLGLKLIHVSKRGPRCDVAFIVSINHNKPSYMYYLFAHIYTNIEIKSTDKNKFLNARYIKNDIN